MIQRSPWLLAAVLFTLATFAVSTRSPLALVIAAAYLSSWLIEARLPRDAASVWGVRLFAYGGVILLARALPVGGYYAMLDARAFLAPGLVIGAELVVQAFRESPRGLRFDPLAVLMLGLLFLIASNTSGDHLFLLAPPTMFCTFMALGDLRQRGRASASVWMRRATLIALAGACGALGHFGLWSNRAQITAIGARLLSGTPASQAAGGDPITDTPQLGSSFAEGASTARLLRIRGTLSDSHLRTAAFAEYANGSWGPSLSARPAPVDALPVQTREALPLIKGTTSPPARLSPDNRTDIDATITVLRATNGIVFAPLNVSALVPDPKGTITSFNWNRFAGPVVAEDAPTPFSYGLVQARQDIGGVQTTQGPLCVPLNGLRDGRGQFTTRVTPRQRAELLEVPDDIDPRVKQLAQQITLDAPTQAAKIEAIAEYFLSNHTYSLQFQRSAQDPVSDFLLNKKAAHCQYFAAGATMLMRSVGIPARYVSGYWAHETDADGTTLVRGRDAHAWSEAYLSGIGWVTVETTPPAGRADPAVSPLPPTQKLSEWFEDSFAKVRAWFAALTLVQMSGLFGLVGALWLLERARQARKRRRNLPPVPLVPLELAPLARRFERVLQRGGITLTPGTPWSDVVPPELEPQTRWVELYNRIRFARDAQRDIAQLERELKELEKR